MGGPRRVRQRTRWEQTITDATCYPQSGTARAFHREWAFATVLLSMVVGVSLGPLSGYLGGPVDVLLMHIADVQLSFPAILIAPLIDEVAHVALSHVSQGSMAVYVLILAIGPPAV